MRLSGMGDECTVLALFLAVRKNLTGPCKKMHPSLRTMTCGFMGCWQGGPFCQSHAGKVQSKLGLSARWSTAPHFK
eukprot:1161066-Pelagomonas_calceolata.AAC.4